MLKGTKSINLSYNSMIGERSAMYMRAEITEAGKSTITKNIQDKELYEANKAECRADMQAFDQLVFDLEDLEDNKAETEVAAE